MRALATVASTMLTVVAVGAGTEVGAGYLIGLACMGFASLWIVFAYGRGK
jgi:hypothetical protein